MTFPVVWSVGGVTLHIHAITDLLASVVGGAVLSWRRRHPPPGLAQTPALPFEQLAWVLVGMAGGALVGAKVLAWVEAPIDSWRSVFTLTAWQGGKTIAGGLLGGWLGTEVAKLVLGIRQATGDAYVLPLTAAIVVGRIGCFFTGLPDHTYGIATTLPWGVDFGDGIDRHPTQLYEIAWLLLLGGGLTWAGARLQPSGAAFRLFMAGYCAFRVLVEFIKPRYTGYAGLSAIQWACLAGLAAALISWRRQARRHRESAHA